MIGATVLELVTLRSKFLTSRFSNKLFGTALVAAPLR
jgi:hypothetical protein